MKKAKKSKKNGKLPMQDNVDHEAAEEHAMRCPKCETHIVLSVRPKNKGEAGGAQHLAQLIGHSFSTGRLEIVTLENFKKSLEEGDGVAVDGEVPATEEPS